MEVPHTEWTLPGYPSGHIVSTIPPGRVPVGYPVRAHRLDHTPREGEHTVKPSDRHSIEQHEAEVTHLDLDYDGNIKVGLKIKAVVSVTPEDIARIAIARVKALDIRGIHLNGAHTIRTSN